MSMTIYEITASVAEHLSAEYERFMLERHIPDVMATGAFIQAAFARSSAGRFRVWYNARSREALDSYLTHHAPGLRAHMGETFPEGVEFSREEWEIIPKPDSIEEVTYLPA